MIGHISLPKEEAEKIADDIVDLLNRQQELHIYHIAEYGKVFVGRSAKEVQDFYIGLVGADQAKEDFDELFSEVENIDKPIQFDGKETTWREVAESAEKLPTQIASCNG